LKSLRLLGLEAEAAAFFDCLADMYRVESATETPGISEESFEFWLKLTLMLVASRAAGLHGCRLVEIPEE
jgi:hypothetical protein